MQFSVFARNGCVYVPPAARVRCSRLREATCPVCCRCLHYIVLLELLLFFMRRTACTHKPFSSKAIIFPLHFLMGRKGLHRKENPSAQNCFFPITCASFSFIEKRSFLIQRLKERSVWCIVSGRLRPFWCIILIFLHQWSTNWIGVSWMGHTNPFHINLLFLHNIYLTGWVGQLK